MESYGVLSSPWREVSWGDNERNLQYVREYQPAVIRHLRVLLYGPVGAGKSSFINSVSSVLRGRPSIPAGVSTVTSDRYHTKKYETHKIKKQTSGDYYPTVFNDIRGLETWNGVRVEDIKLAMMGHINDGYTFNHISALSQGDPGYNPSPTLDDKIHVLVCVHSANSAEINESILQKMREITEVANDMGIPQIAILTKVDEACDDTAKSLKNVYKSKRVKQKMSYFSSDLGIPMNCIFPIKNYSEETSLDIDVDALILNALRAIISCGDNFLDKLFREDGNTLRLRKVGAAPPSPLLSSPWRQMSWGDNERNLQYVREYQPEDVPHLRVLLCGPVGAGKSSFINSVTSVLRGRIAIPAGVSLTTSDKSYTKKYRSHRIKKTRGNHYPIVFNDIMGLENGSGNEVEDIKLAMMGHIMEGYRFNPACALSQGDPGYKPCPSPADKVHVLVYVHSAYSAEIKESVLQKMKETREVASDLGIPQVAVITKIDEACGETQRNLKEVYRSKHLKKKMSDFSAALGITMNCIFPVKNYSQEISQDADVDALILAALRPIIDFGDDFLDSTFL